MKRDIKEMRSSANTYTSADKTSNFYKIPKEQYNHFKNNAITSMYKKTNSKVKQSIDKSGIKFARKTGVINRMETNGSNNCFITLKDHKSNFENNPSTRLINPAKNEIGRISKSILDKINSNLKISLGINQWKNTTSVVDWFKSIPDKSRHSFVIFDIKDFYPSIKEALLKEALAFAQGFINIASNDIEVVFHARKSLLFDGNDTWMKKDGLFDVTMGAYDGAEICELIGTYLLSIIIKYYDKSNIGLYRDDGLAVFKNASGPQNERIKKVLQKIFKEKFLSIEIECNKKIVNYLDVTLNLNDGSYKPYHKDTDETNYIHSSSDHPPNIIKQIPISIEKRLSTLSSSKQIFDESKKHYQEALNRCGYTHTLNYTPVDTSRRQKRSRNIIWFNPPFSRTVSTNIGKSFLNLIDKHFPRSHKFRKLFNRNNIKVSYGCMGNFGSIINSHNQKVLTTNSKLQLGKCNCRVKSSCPLNGHCLTENVLYQATITSTLPNYNSKIYKGISYLPFKLRYRNHIKAFNNQRYRNDCELSKEVWCIKDLGGSFDIKWQVLL